MVGESTFLQTQGPKDLQSRNHPRQHRYLEIAISASLKPAGYARHGLSNK